MKVVVNLEKNVWKIKASSECRSDWTEITFFFFVKYLVINWIKNKPSALILVSLRFGSVSFSHNQSGKTQTFKNSTPSFLCGCTVALGRLIYGGHINLSTNMEAYMFTETLFRLSGWTNSTVTACLFKSLLVWKRLARWNCISLQQTLWF